METVTFTCQHCGEMVTVRVDSLDKEVECPHCLQMSIAPEAPARQAASAEEAAPPVEEAAASVPEPPTEPAPPPTLAEQETNLSPPKGDFGAEVVDGSPASVVDAAEAPLPNLQLDAAASPEEPALAPPPEPAAEVTVPSAEPEPAPAPADASTEEPTVTATPAPAEGPILATALPVEPEVAADAAPKTRTEAEVPEEDTALPMPHRRVAVKASAAVPLLLIFLIPYSVVATVAVVWLIYQQRSQPAPFDPLELLPDTEPGEGRPLRLKDRRTRVDEPLPEKLKTSLKQSLTVGAVKVTPLLIDRTPRGELVLLVKLRNVSRNLAFNPLPRSFLTYQEGNPHSRKPYSFVEIGRNHLYNPSLEWKETPPRLGGPPFNGVLGPGEEVTVLLRTPDKKGYADLVNNLERSQGEVVWRLHVRRGFVQVKGNDVSATAVVGVRIGPLPRPEPANARLCPIPGFQISGIF
jgi:hypothetical protein